MLGTKNIKIGRLGPNVARPGMSNGITFYERLEDVPWSTPGYLKVLDPIRAKTLDATAWGLKPEASLKGDVKQYQQCIFKGDIEQNTPKFMLKASKLLMLRPQNSILQHLLPEAGP